MARKKVLIQKLKTREARMTAYAKRKSTLLKRASELSEMGVDVGMIMFSPTNRLNLLSSDNKSIEDIFLRFFNLSPELRGGEQKDEEHAVESLICSRNERRLVEVIAKKEAASEQIKTLEKEIAETKKKLGFYAPIDTQNITTIRQANLREEIILNALKRIENLEVQQSGRYILAQQTLGTQGTLVHGMSSGGPYNGSTQRTLVQGMSSGGPDNGTQGMSSGGPYNGGIQGTLAQGTSSGGPYNGSTQGTLVQGMSSGGPYNGGTQGTLVQGMSSGDPYNGSTQGMSSGGAYNGGTQGTLVEGMSSAGMYNGGSSYPTLADFKF